VGGRRVGARGVGLAASVGVAATVSVEDPGPVVRTSDEDVPQDHVDCRGQVLAAGLPLWWVSDSP